MDHDRAKPDGFEQTPLLPLRPPVHLVRRAQRRALDADHSHLGLEPLRREFGRDTVKPNRCVTTANSPA
jgi:hypothetical protein